MTACVRVTSDTGVSLIMWGVLAQPAAKTQKTMTRIFFIVSKYNVLVFQHQFVARFFENG